jgi:hypothetical protein
MFMVAMNNTFIMCVRRRLWVLLVYYRLYPTVRQFPLLFNVKYSQRYMSRIHETEAFLADRIDELRQWWDSRHEDYNRIPHVFDERVVGIVDTSPIEFNSQKILFGSG